MKLLGTILVLAGSFSYAAGITYTSSEEARKKVIAGKFIHLFLDNTRYDEHKKYIEVTRLDYSREQADQKGLKIESLNVKENFFRMVELMCDSSTVHPDSPSYYSVYCTTK